MTFVLDGHTTVEHALPITPLRDDVVTFMAKSTTSYTRRSSWPTEGSRATSGSTSTTTSGRTRLQKFVPQRIVDGLGRIRGIMATDPADWHHIDVAASAQGRHARRRAGLLGAHGRCRLGNRTGRCGRSFQAG